MDYRDLLGRYMRAVAETEGTDFLSDPVVELAFTESELQELHSLAMTYYPEKRRAPKPSEF